MHDVKEYGVVCDLAANPDVVGLVAAHQVRPSAKHPETRKHSLRLTFSEWSLQSCATSSDEFLSTKEFSIVTRYQLL